MTSPARKKAQEKALELKKKVGKQPKRILGKTYVTKKGDTISDIADKMGLTVRQIKKSNPKLEDLNKIPTGMKLKLPQVKSIGENVDFARQERPKKVYDLSKEEMKALQMNVGGVGLKKPTANQVGLKKLPKQVRNKMGYMYGGGMSKKPRTGSMDYRKGGMLILSIDMKKKKK
tara:strand:- start:174 stop:695 length:522 start_codon:yes stop_codon:yes gene_type:complete